MFRYTRQLMIGAMAALCVSNAAVGEELLRGEITDLEGDSQPFLVTGENREEIVGGTIQVGSASYTIAKQSRLGLIGAARFSKGEKEFGEYAVLSSSFSKATAKGIPWVAARRYVGCDTPYNTFVAIYRVYGVERVNALGSSPYGTFTDDMEASDESVVYCLYSAPPAPSGAAGESATSS